MTKANVFNFEEAKKDFDLINQSIKKAISKNEPIFIIVGSVDGKQSSYVHFNVCLIANNNYFNSKAIMHYIYIKGIDSLCCKGLIFKEVFTSFVGYNLKYYAYDIRYKNGYASNLLEGLKEFFNLLDYENVYLRNL